MRADFLKGRQQGCSTYVAARFYHRTTRTSGQRTFILTHEEAATTNLFEIVERYQKNRPEHLRPSTGNANAKELYFDTLDSGYKVGTAGTKAVGRSSTIQLFHGSEVAFWPFADTHARAPRGFIHACLRLVHDGREQRDRRQHDQLGRRPKGWPRAR
jgi:hypothetical protein